MLLTIWFNCVLNNLNLINQHPKLFYESWTPRRDIQRSINIRDISLKVYSIEIKLDTLFSTLFLFDTNTMIKRVCVGDVHVVRISYPMRFIQCIFARLNYSKNISIWSLGKIHCMSQNPNNNKVTTIRRLTMARNFGIIGERM